MSHPPTPPEAAGPLADALATGAPFALLSRQGSLELLLGDVVTVPTLADIPLPDDSSPGPKALALVPYRQLAERGFAHVDDGAPLRCLRVSAHHRLTRQEALAALPTGPVQAHDGRFDVDDERYAGIVETVLREEIGRGEGANFVIHRCYTAEVTGDPLRAAAAAAGNLLRDERGAYWTFLVHTQDRTLVGATPERHVSVDGGLIMMNPISGTFRRPSAAADQAAGPRSRRDDEDLDALLRFLADPKEINELYMVLDEELKMMANVAEHGGQVIGPYLKEMSHLVHTEYLLAGRGDKDVREVLRQTMFAPTVTGSPLENACRVIARHEGRGRGYYSGVLALLGTDAAGRQTLDAPILIRYAEFDPAGRLRVPVGATLVRDSTPAGEVAETKTKAAAVLAALGLGHRSPASSATAAPLADDVRVQAALAARNRHLSRFWLTERRADQPAALTGRVLVVDAEDTFTGMLVHQLRALGLTPTLRPWHADGLGRDLDTFDLVVPGPGPGNPTDPVDPKMITMRRLVRRLLDERRPTLAVCLGHQVLAGRLGLTLHRRAEPYQGLQREIDLFGRARRVGYYASFTALAPADQLTTPYGPVEICRDPRSRAVHALRGPTFVGVQFHPESVLTEDGPEILTGLLAPLLTADRLAGSATG